MTKGHGPWSMEGIAIIMQKWEPGMTKEDFTITKILFHIHRMPFELRRPEFARSLAVHAGQIKEIKNGGKGGTSHLLELSYSGPYTRLRIEIDTAKPILTGLFLRRLNRKPTWIYLKYEKLPNVCYRCGMLNHDTRHYKSAASSTEKLYDGWLKAEEQSTFIP